MSGNQFLVARAPSFAGKRGKNARKRVFLTHFWGFEADSSKIFYHEPNEPARTRTIQYFGQQVRVRTVGTSLCRTAGTRFVVKKIMGKKLYTHMPDTVSMSGIASSSYSLYQQF